MTDPPPTALPTADVDRRRARWVLLALTVVGGLLRFAWLGCPPLWGDEALVYWRTCGTYGQLLRPLHEDGFPPLHYELAWALVRWLGRTPGPGVMRLVPALCGTLLVPAVYGLARQLLSRRAALSAAGFTAVNAFALFYSRDAKMYAEAWVAETAAVAAMLAWARGGRATAWLAWVAAAAAAAGFQTLTLVPTVGLGPLVLLTGRRPHWRQGVLWAVGVGLIAAGPAGYYLKFNRWVDNLGDRGWRSSGIAWVGAFNYGRTGGDEVRYLATTFLTGWEWPRAAAFDHMPAGRGRLLRWGATAVLAGVAAGALPWPGGWRDRSLWGVVRRRPVPAAAGVEATPEPPWRVALWLGAWVGLPLYLFYCRSIPGFESPGEILAGVGHPWVWGTALAVVVGGLVACQPVRSTLRWVGAVAAVAAVVGAGQLCVPAVRAAAAAAAAAGRPWASVWVPRYLGFAWPAVAVAAAALVGRLPTVAVRRAVLAGVVAANLGLFAFRLWGNTEPPVERMAADVWAAQPAGGRAADTLVMFDLYPAMGGNGGGHLLSDPGRYYLQLLAGRPMSPDRFKDSLSGFTFRRGGVRWIPAAAGPDVRRVIVWDQTPVRATTAAGGDGGLPTEVPRGWSLTTDEATTVRDVWTGQDAFRYRRRTYVRAGGSALVPTGGPGPA